MMEGLGTSSFLEITVASPERVGEGIMDTHVEYKVHIKTNLSIFKSGEFTVLRRYRHFDALREELKDKYKGYLIPPLPEKTVLNRFNSEFMEFRRRELQKFLERLSNHHFLQQTPEFKTFLEAESYEQIASKSSSNSSNSSQQSSGLLSFIGTSLTNQLSQNFTQQKEPDQWFDSYKNYVTALETQLMSLERATNQLIRKQKELTQAFTEFGTVTSLLASTEADHDSKLSVAFQDLAELSNQVRQLNEKLTDNEAVYFEDVVRDYLRIISSVKEMLAARSEKLALYQNQSKQLELKKDKIKGKDLEELTNKTEQSKAEFNATSELCKAELNEMAAIKSRDLKNMISKFVQMNIDIEIQKLDEWKTILSKLAD